MTFLGAGHFSVLDAAMVSIIDAGAVLIVGSCSIVLSIVAGTSATL